MMKIAKKLCLISLLALSSSAAFAAVPGFYVGAQLGDADNHYSNSNANVTSSNIDDTGIAGRIFGGYEFTPLWGLELGYIRFSNIKYSNINGTASSGEIKQDAVDILGKRSFPFDNGVSLVAKAGMAVETARHDSNVGNDDNEVQPVFGIGVSYDIIPQIPVELSYMRYQDVGGNIPSSDFLALGVSYYFG